MTLGVGKTMLMGGGACAAELRLMVVWACVFVVSWGWLSCCEIWRFVFLFLFLVAICILFGLVLYFRGGGCVDSSGSCVLRALQCGLCGCGSCRFG